MAPKWPRGPKMQAGTGQNEPKGTNMAQNGAKNTFLWPFGTLLTAFGRLPTAFWGPRGHFGAILWPIDATVCKNSPHVSLQTAPKIIPLSEVAVERSATQPSATSFVAHKSDLI